MAPLGLLCATGCGQTSARSASLPRSLSCDVDPLRLFGPRPPPPQAVSAPLASSILALSPRGAVRRRPGGGNGALGCEPFAEIEAGADLFATGGRTDPVVSLVPDGWRRCGSSTDPVRRSRCPSPATVSSSRRRLKALQRRAAALSAEEGGCWRVGHGPFRCGNPHLTAAQNRRVALRSAQANAAYRQAAAASDPTQVDWLDAAGQVVRVLRPPTAVEIEAVDVGDLRAPIGE